MHVSCNAGSRLTSLLRFRRMLAMTRALGLRWAGSEQEAQGDSAHQQPTNVVTRSIISNSKAILRRENKVRQQNSREHRTQNSCRRAESRRYR